MKTNRPTLLFGLFVLFGGGTMLHGLKECLTPSTHNDGWQRVTGGMGTIISDWFWLETTLAWENRDADKVRRMIDCTVKADPRSAYFWQNGARIFAYDFPAWQSEGEKGAPRAVQAHWRALGAHEALRLLERGQKWHGHSAVLHLEMANICWYVLGDRARAAGHYRRAAAQSDAPDYAVRISARFEEEMTAGMTLTR